MQVPRSVPIMYLEYHAGSQQPRRLATMARDGHALRMRFTDDWTGIDDAAKHALVEISALIAESVPYLIDVDGLLSHVAASLPKTVILTAGEPIRTADIHSELVRLGRTIDSREELLTPERAGAGIHQACTAHSRRRASVLSRIVSGLPRSPTYAYVAIAVAFLTIIGLTQLRHMPSHRVSGVPVVATATPRLIARQMRTVGVGEAVQPDHNRVVSANTARSYRRRRGRDIGRDKRRDERSPFILPVRHIYIPEPIMTAHSDLSLSSIATVNAPAPYTAPGFSAAAPSNIHVVVRLLRVVAVPFRKIAQLASGQEPGSDRVRSEVANDFPRRRSE